MYFVINSKTYTDFDGLGFSPETDLTNNSLPINEFQARLFTNDQIAYGQWANLYDDNNNLWAHYWLRYCERIGRDDDRQTYIVKIIGQSPLAFLERVKLPAEYINDDAYSAIQDVLDEVGNMGQIGDIIQDNVISTDFAAITINGFAPEQTARERLQWLLMTAGGYVQSWGDVVIHIEKVPTSGGAIIPIEATFWKPSITFRDYVTKIKVHGYSYTQGTPASGDTYVTDGTNFWIQTEQVISVTNNNAPSGAPANEIEIEGVTIIDPTRASYVCTNLAAYYFNRVEIDSDVINNWSYKPGDRVTTFIDEDTLYAGYIDKTDFSFGLQSRSKLHLTGALGVDGAILTLVYKWGDVQVASRRYYFPKGYSYSITTEYLDQWVGGHRYIFRPTTATISGTLNSDTTQNVSVAVALDYYYVEAQDRADMEAQYNAALAMLEAQREAERNTINKIYKGNSKKKKRKQALETLEQVYQEQIDTVTSGFTWLLNDVSTTMHILHVVSVDEVALKSQVIDDPTDRTVEIS